MSVFLFLSLLFFTMAARLAEAGTGNTRPVRRLAGAAGREAVGFAGRAAAAWGRKERANLGTGVRVVV
jgi:hypothetical protein